MKQLILLLSLLCSTSLWALQLDIEIRMNMDSYNEGEYEYQSSDYIASLPDWRVEQLQDRWGEMQRFAVYTKKGIELVDGKWHLNMDILDVDLKLNESAELEFEYSLEFYDGSNSLSTKLFQGLQHEFGFNNSDG